MAYSTIRERDLAYLAGFLDGEGSIGISKKSKRNSYLPQITFNNTHLGVMMHTKVILKTPGLLYTKQNTERNQKIVYKICVQNKSKAKEILELLYDYLIIKKKQAKLVLEFLDLNTCKQGIRNYQPSKRELQIYKMVTKLNQRGIQ